jgi:hypothetical protein
MYQKPKTNTHMKLIYKSVFTLSFVLSAMFVRSQVSTAQMQTAVNPNTMPQGRTCGTGILPQQFETWYKSILPAATSNPKGGGNNETQSVFNIPVIVHVVHNGQAVGSGPNISQAQVIDQINILNKDFNGTNADTTLIPSVFKPLLGKAKINFCLAVVNPSNVVLAEPGIDRLNSVSKGWTSGAYSQAYIDATIKPQSIWDPNKYFNIWVCNLGSSLLGYATFPNPGMTGLLGLSAPYGTATSDGVVCLYTAFGSIGSAQAPYNKGRTATHEIGHWAGLRHVWGDANCGNDECNDTPTQSALNFGCPSFPQVSCSNGPNGNMFMNYMDYVDDGCMQMFSKDQVFRMQLILANSQFRQSLLTSTVCKLSSAINDVGIVNIMSPTYSQAVNCDPFITPSFSVMNFGSNAVTSITFTYNVDNTGTQTLNWTGNLAPYAATVITLPQINLANGSHYFQVNALNPNATTDTYLNNNFSFQPFSISNGYTIAASGATTICSGNPATLTASGGATTWTWNPSAITGPTASVMPGTTTIYTVSGSLATCVKTATVLITVNITPTLTANSTTICTGGQATLAASGAPTYSWSTSQTTSVINVSPASNTVYTVYGINGGCVSSKQVSVTIGTSLGIVPVASSTMFCSGATTTITASGASTYTWQPGNLNGSSIAVTPNSSTTYTVSGTAAACSGSNSILITVNATPTLAPAPSSPTICTPGPGTNLNVSGATNYTWNPGNLTGAVVAVNPVSTTVYTVVGTTTAGCTDTKTTQIVVNGKPTVFAATSNPTLCIGNVGSVFATGATTYTWNPGNMSGATPTISPSTTTTYTVIGATNGCTDTKTITIQMVTCTGLATQISNLTISVYPNPVNDELFIKANEDVKVTIYNAIGQIVRTEAIARNGKISTSEMPNAVYFVHVKGNNETRIYKVVKQ